MSDEAKVTRTPKVTSAFMEETVNWLMEKDPAYAEFVKNVREIQRPILKDLASVGYEIRSLAQLRHLGRDWKSAVPVLLKWLPLIEHSGIKEEIITCLSVPWTGDRATNYLIQAFKKYAPIDPQHADPEDRSRESAVQFINRLATKKMQDPSASLAWTIGNALSLVEVRGFEKQIIRLCRTWEYGIARQMMVMTLHRLRDPEAEEAALDLLSDEDVKVHAIIALGKMKSKRALFQLEKLLTDKKAFIRKEARKAITKIMK